MTTGSRKLISFSLYGTDPTYTVGAVKNVKLYKELLPDYTCIFFCGLSISDGVVNQLLSLGAEVRYISGREDWGATMWRLLVLNDWDNFDRVIFRDCDSRPTRREVAAVRAWEASGKPVHVMRDHPAHMAPVLAGMWGITAHEAAKACQFVPLASSIRMSNDYHEHIDQGWLEQYIGPTLRFAALQHCSYWTTYYGPSEPFPTEREGNEFVGAAFAADGSPRYPDHMVLDDLCSRCRCTINCERREA